MYLIPLIILIEGFVSIAIEMLTIRQLLPVAGSSVIVTSLIIGIFLLFLALGYERGGRVKEHLSRVLQRNFFMTGLIAGVGLSYLFIELFFLAVQKQTGTNLLIPLVCYLFVVLAPMVYLLGQTLPITINLARQNQTAGKLAGRTLFLSTLGSFLGAVLTTLVLLHFFGVAATIFVVFTLLMLLTVCLADKNNLIFSSIMAAGFGVLIFNLHIANEKLFFRSTNNYANYQILTDANSRLAANQKMLIINNTASSFHDKDNKGFKYIELIKQRLFTEMKLHDADILVLGAGGFTISEQNNGHNHFTYIDIDKQLSDTISPEFQKGAADRLVINDARNYLNSTDKLYDAIIVDAYSDTKSIPTHLITREFMQSIWRHMKDHSYAVFNIIANPTFQDSYSKRIDNTIHSVFGNCITNPTFYKNSETNIIYICSKQIQPEDRTVYVDNLNNSTMDAFLR